jgi:nicotinate dehydrogenase subunit B
VTVYTGKVELGTGVRTALSQIAAEELDMAPSLITFLTADTGASPDEGLTAGSHTIADSGSALLNASAQVRGLVVDAAARHFGVAGSVMSARNAVIKKAPDDRGMTYGEAVGLVDLHRRGLARLAAEELRHVRRDRHVTDLESLHARDGDRGQCFARLAGEGLRKLIDV